MDIPNAYRVVRKAQLEAESPQMAKYAPVFGAYVDAVLADEWNRKPQWKSIKVAMRDGNAVISMEKEGTGSQIEMVMTLAEFAQLHGDMGRLLGL